ncbi:MAG: type II toxin-antitoxin system VapB family antitoxin [Xenophilus sp.]
MRTNIDIDDELLAKAMHAGPFTTKKETVEAGLRLLARQAAYREILKWKGKLKWEGDEAIDWTQAPENEPETPAAPLPVQEPRARYQAKKTTASGSGGKKAARGAGR